MDITRSWLTFAFGPSLSAIILTLVVAISLPILLHIYLYRAKTAIASPTFLLVGPSGAGKTSFLTLLERGTPSATHVSQTPLTVEVSLPPNHVPRSAQFRSTNDPGNATGRRILISDTPGHGKLRHFASKSIADHKTLTGVIFLVDAADLSAEGSARGLTEAAEYLHDTLLMLQRRAAQSKSSKGPADMPVLVAANKLDLFTALPSKLVKTALEGEISKLRATRSKGLQDSGIGVQDDESEEREWLGEYGSGSFTFGQMEEFSIQIEVLGGNVLGGDGSDISTWWSWIAAQM